VRTDFDPQDPSPSFYRLLTAVVVPRPIAWVSTRSAAGVDNLAPHSFFTVSCVTPPIVQFTSVGRKDSLRNAEATGEFVVNFTSEAMFEKINATATDFPSDVSEFDTVGLTREPSARVAPARVAESPVALECVFHSALCLGDSTVVFGRVVLAAVDDAVLVDGHPEISRLRPLSRLGRNEWGDPPTVRSIERIPFAAWPGHFEGATSPRGPASG
jgi:flavin reductase (DIM6/NTAB) family NADH-FMN oxidoreductase RutF